MRTITTTSGVVVALDGDALAIIEVLSRDLARRKELAYGFEEIDREIHNLVGQMTDEELRVYLKESLFMSLATSLSSKGSDFDGRSSPAPVPINP